jgi:hypothetical protein
MNGDTVKRDRLELIKAIIVITIQNFNKLDTHDKKAVFNH